MTTTPPLTVLRTPAWPRLLRRLEGDLDQLRESTLRPVELLELMAADTLGALGDDVLAADRLRATIHTAWPYGDASLTHPTMIAGSNAAIVHAVYEPGVLDFGALLLVALAAIRVAPPGMAAELVAVVHGLALKADFAEVMGRLDPAMPDSGELSGLARAHMMLAMTESRRRPFERDPVELARKQCLAEIFGSEIIGEQLKEAALWHGAFSDEITGVRPDPDDSNLLLVIGRLSSVKPDSGGRFPAGTMAVIFASAAGEPNPATVKSVLMSQETGVPSGLKVVIPDHAVTGWVGFSIDERVAQSNLHREKVREQLRGLFRDKPCLRHTTVSPDLIPFFTLEDKRRGGKKIAVPPRTGANRYHAPEETFPDAPPPKETTDAQVVLIRPAILGEAGPIDKKLALGAIRGAAHEARMSVVVEELPWLDDALAVLVERPGSPESPAVTLLLDAMSRTALQTPGFENAIWLALLPNTETGGWIRGTTATAARALAVSDPASLTKLFVELSELQRPLGAKMRRLRILGRIADQVEIEHTQEETRAAGSGGPIVTDFEAISYGLNDYELGRMPITTLSKNPTTAIELLIPMSPEIVRVDITHPRLGILKKIPRVTEPPSRFVAALDRVESDDAEGDEADRNAWRNRRRMRWSWDHPQGIAPMVTVLVESGGIATPAFSIGKCDYIVDLPVSRLTQADALIAVATDGWNTIAVPLELGRVLENDAPVILRALADGRYFADIPNGWKHEWSLNGVVIEGEAPRDAEGLRSLVLRPKKPKRKIEAEERVLELDADDAGWLVMVARKSRRAVKEYRQILGGGK